MLQRQVTQWKSPCNSYVGHAAACRRGRGFESESSLAGVMIGKPVGERLN